MNIIPSPDEGVKLDAWTKHKRKADFVATHMIHDYRDEVRHRGYLMKGCGDKLFFQKDCERYKLASAWLCRDRLCPVCSWRMSLQRVADMQKTIAAMEKTVPRSKAIHVVLTVKSVPLSLLRETVQLLAKGFTKLKKRKLFRDYVAGYCRSIEITKNPEMGVYHPHIHCICIVPDWYTKQISIGDWSEMWRDSCQLRYNPIVWAEHAYVPKSATPSEKVFDDYRSDAAKAAVIEAIKYCLKPDSLVASASVGEVGDLALAIKGVRMVSYGGCIKSARASIGVQDDDQAEQLPELELDLSEPTFSDRYLVCYRWASETHSYVRVQ